MKKENPNCVSDKEIYFNINQVAKKLDVVPSTIRNWEKSGLFTAKRKGNNYRVFDFNDIQFLIRIKKYSVEESMNMALIKKLLAKDTISSASVEKKYPKDIFHRKLKEYRENNAQTLDEVSNAIGISSSYLSRIEQGECNVSLEILEKLSQFYGESPLTFFAVKPSESKTVIAFNEGIPLETSLEGTEVFALSDTYANFAPVKFIVAVGCGDMKSHCHTSGQEFIYVLSGKLQVTLDDSNDYILNPNDSIHFSSTRMHNWHNSGNSKLVMLWIHSSL